MGRGASTIGTSVEGTTAWNEALLAYEDAVHLFSDDLRLMASGKLGTASPLKEGAGSLEAVNRLTSYVSWRSGLKIAPLVDPGWNEATQVPFTSSRVLERSTRSADRRLAEILRSHADLARIYPDILGSGRGGTKADFSEARCVLIPALIGDVSDWLERRDPHRASELAALVREWNATTGWAQ